MKRIQCSTQENPIYPCHSAGCLDRGGHPGDFFGLLQKHVRLKNIVHALFGNFTLDVAIDDETRRKDGRHIRHFDMRPRALDFRRLNVFVHVT
jgi:hypothetical protein